MKKAASKRVLVLPDIHLRPPARGVPSGEDTATLTAVARYAGDHVWDEVVLLGDLMDFDCISDHNAKKLRLVEGARLERDFAYANAWLNEWQAILGPAKWTYIEGNHDERIERLIDAQPVFEGQLELERSLHLKQRGINWVRYWTKGEVYSIGNATYGHGLYTSRYHASRHVDNYGCCFFYGHTHDVQSMPKTLWGPDKTLVAQSMGCLCRYDQPYLKGRPSKWQQAFGVFHFRPDGFFNHYVVNIFNHHFTSPEGQSY